MSVEQAWEVARRAHGGQVDKAGRPYVEAHVADVYRRVVAAGGDEDQQVAALLHDVLEDTGTTEDDLRQVGFPDRALHVVRLMTHADVPVEEYLARLAADPAARLVKVSDIASNTDPDRMAQLEPATRRRLREKYAHYLDALGENSDRLREAAAHDEGRPAPLE